MLLCGDDRIRGICEQRMLQVDPVRLTDRAWIDLGRVFIRFLLYHGINCKLFRY